MKILISGVCGFVGRTIAEGLLDAQYGGTYEIVGIDNLIRPGSWLNRDYLMRSGAKVYHGDIRQASDLELIGHVDWVIDCAANSSVLAGVNGESSTRQLVEHNLLGTVNLLEHCKGCHAGFILLSTSRVYGIEPLRSLNFEINASGYSPVADQDFPPGLSRNGVAENCSTKAPISLYGATKLASETLALEYGGIFDFPVWVNRCGVLAGAGQFGRSDQGIFSYWIHSWRARKTLKYIGFDGTGHQVRDCLNPTDLIPLIKKQLDECDKQKPRVVNVGGGRENSMSLKRLSDWCENRFGPRQVENDLNQRPFDIPWLVMDISQVSQIWNWCPTTNIESTLAEIAKHADNNPEWLKSISE